MPMVGACQTGDVCFSNRPFGVKRFQTIHRHGVDVARGLVLLFGIGARALPSWDSRTRRNNLWGGLAVLQTVGPSGHTNSPHPSSREGHLSTARWNTSFLRLHLLLSGSQAAATNHVWGVMDVLALTDFPDVRFKSLIQSAKDGSIVIFPRGGGYHFRPFPERHSP